MDADWLRVHGQSSPLTKVNCVRTRSWNVNSAGFVPSVRLCIRIHQRVSRYRQRGRNRNLHQFAETLASGSVVWPLEWNRGFCWRHGGCYGHYQHAARGNLGGSKYGPQLMHGRCNLVDSHLLEPWDLAARNSRLKLSYLGWIDRWGWDCLQLATGDGRGGGELA